MATDSGLFHLLRQGGFVMWPLVICSFLAWAVILERGIRFLKLDRALKSFHLEVTNALLRNELNAARALCVTHATLPTAEIIRAALDRLAAKDDRLKITWREAMERRRQLVNQELKQGLWLLGTIGSASPFIGLFGTVVGILESFQEMAKTGTGGFNVVAAGISEALIATAAGIVVAVVAVMSYNAFQTKLSGLILTVRLQIEEISELLAQVIDTRELAVNYVDPNTQK